jgi:hypothetical protein
VRRFRERRARQHIDHREHKMSARRIGGAPSARLIGRSRLDRDRAWGRATPRHQQCRLRDADNDLARWPLSCSHSRGGRRHQHVTRAQDLVRLNARPDMVPFLPGLSCSSRRVQHQVVLFPSSPTSGARPWHRQGSLAQLRPSIHKLPD